MMFFFVNLNKYTDPYTYVLSLAIPMILVVALLSGCFDLAKGTPQCVVLALHTPGQAAAQVAFLASERCVKKRPEKGMMQSSRDTSKLGMADTVP